MFTDRSVSSAETDGSEGHSGPRSGSAGEEIQQPGAQEGDHGAAGGRGESSVSSVRRHKCYRYLNHSGIISHSSPNIQNSPSPCRIPRPCSTILLKLWFLYVWAEFRYFYDCWFVFSELRWSLIFHRIGFKFIQNIPETLRIIYNFHSFKKLLLNVYSNQLNYRKSFFTRTKNSYLRYFSTLTTKLCFCGELMELCHIYMLFKNRGSLKRKP